MGFKFLKHISRTKALIFLIDLSSDNYLEAFNVLYKELEEFAPDLVKRKRLIIGTKTDLEGTDENLKELRSAHPEENVPGISVYTRDGLKDLEIVFQEIIGE